MSASSAPQQPTQPPLLPTLSALLPLASLASTTSTISLLSIHSEPYTHHDVVYLNTQPVLPGQHRFLRLRASGSKGGSKPPSSSSSSSSALSLAYLSARLREYEDDDVSVKAIVEVDLAGQSGKDDVQDFVKTLGFVYSHEYTRSGILFHIPLPHPTLTLHLTISRLALPLNSSPSTPSSEPYLVQLQPSRPISGVAARGELGMTELVDLMRATADRIDGLEWGSGVL
ncbi:hypothetical protein DB88DRAFT_541702 [Papiliotrema laurentii]|uniref:Uncharacterized protein n=1 Tax=Papiliotrema laurentii TaxID=5418 RepID=A0AAD9CXJ9_PAPLA|nr:hypothetical protein DB88DRAFT_541702 [Papiliotrema laurentii]